jgi:CDGSH-type Zn-finger protein
MTGAELLAILQNMDPENLSGQLWFEGDEGAFEVRSLKSADADGLVLSYEYPIVANLAVAGVVLTVDGDQYLCRCGHSYFKQLSGNAYCCTNCDAYIQGS